MIADQSPVPVLLMNDTRVDHHHGCSSVMTAITHLIERNGMIVDRYWPANADWRGVEAFENALKRAELVVVNGEGTIHHNRPAGRRLVEVGAAARAAGKPVALINTGWEANSDDLTDCLQNFDLVAARDTKSAIQMRAGSDQVRTVPDLSFYFASMVLSEQPHVDQGSRDGIGFTDNVDRTKAVVLENLRRQSRGQTVSVLQNGTDGYLRFLRNGLSLREDFKTPAFAASLINLRHRLWGANIDDPVRFLKALSGLKLLVAGRFHACTLAIALGTPFVAQSSNTGKIAALAEDVRLDSWRTSGTLTVEGIREAAARGWSETEVENRKAYQAAAQVKSETLFADLRRLVS